MDSLFIVVKTKLRKVLSPSQFLYFQNIWHSLCAAYYQFYFAQKYHYQKFRMWIKPFQMAPFIPTGKYHSQRGQDWFLDTVVFPGKQHGFFLDIGGNHPLDINNTLFFERAGWTGLAFEPQSALCELWKTERTTPCFPFLLGEEEKEVSFVQVVEDDWRHALSGVQSDTLLAQLDNNCKTETLVLKQVRLANVLQEHGITEVDFISLDVEGHELQVLRGIDFSKVHIKCIILENDLSKYGDDAVRNFLFNKNFKHIARLCGDDVFVHTSFLPQLHATQI
ncbi:FkbM family methyltransferase [Desulfovibrio cuneatus]|uniref:FkbM family methyltransferase n=1 Tax=Desulfovibrio cuneatus TaxID=159728 RepID=UPI000415FE7A|nr:FkbM family methyltransferase [Desulfovibrio cuneatus]